MSIEIISVVMWKPVDLGVSCTHLATERLYSFTAKGKGGFCLDIAGNRCEAAELNPTLFT